MFKGAGEMAQQLRELAILLEDSSSIPSTHMAARNCLTRSDTLTQTYIHTNAYKMKRKKEKEAIKVVN